MSERGFLIVYLGAEPGWLRIADGRIVIRQSGHERLPIPGEDEGEAVVLVVPGSDVAIHWAAIPGSLAPPQALAAARIMAGEVSAEPTDMVHVAYGPEADEDGERPLAIVARGTIDGWLAEAAALGLDPDIVVPEPMLLAPPEDGVRLFKRAGFDNVRGPKRAFAAEPEIAALLVGDERVESIDAAAFDNDLGAVLDGGTLNLRQGSYAKRRRWKLEAGLVKRLALIGAAILLVTLLIQLTMIARYSFAADGLEREAVARARDAIPGNVEIVDPEAQLRERLYQAGGGPGYGEIASAAFAAIRDTAGVELQSMIYAQDGSLQIVAAAPGQPELTALQQRMAQAGLVVTPGAVRDGGGRQIGDFTVRAP
ncbi:type II secretion system protein GspL [Parasphingopyxis marina]|uniref:General secretion pathway protein GspL n=1 Tax=Parasphingopyxis marina TaxID=2761622 RepID=A0A842HYR3_9SPHN|nr:type II secretion system protein GspL [Parasphingopyxis marina]MBC2778072.1 general secretion pathway protein GspL [Parasphingopyxis marina]